LADTVSAIVGLGLSGRIPAKYRRQGQQRAAAEQWAMYLRSMLQKRDVRKEE
jgi:hypothetical protein